MTRSCDPRPAPTGSSSRPDTDGPTVAMARRSPRRRRSRSWRRPMRGLPAPRPSRRTTPSRRRHRSRRAARSRKCPDLSAITRPARPPLTTRCGLLRLWDQRCQQGHRSLKALRPYPSASSTPRSSTPRSLTPAARTSRLNPDEISQDCRCRMPSRRPQSARRPGDQPASCLRPSRVREPFTSPPAESTACASWSSWHTTTAVVP